MFVYAPYWCAVFHLVV